ncbi:hypothetical protein ERO13_A11G076800v2 [Gossypium hirsutum]|uniref:Phosphoglycerate mutase family protein n=2 Tax=Gossypium TaxID=3633 RepID=A0A5J5TK57_GOSBA|nr:uncharacterized protein LOC107911877 isoform X1 [Gossypium hirsutum]KAB2056144.1 hypothetical protein ES319_A11G083900v1 [Gossypium barbadense]KAB2056145.1 hypothetical protein ES319_A11G083900v1 [Gossypium barbadense]KAG4173708.1 hypothetical protein ERO13_A11G076800v2 [Gossypium hirsutum]
MGRTGLCNCFIASFPTPISICRRKKPLIPWRKLNLMATSMDPSGTKTYQQNVLVMRHGDRLDNFDQEWEKTADRPWDPPLIQNGLNRAFGTGREFRTRLPFPIHRVFVSPFLRCIQTASEVVAALCSVDDDPNAKSSNDVIAIDPSRVKVSIEYGLCEMLNKTAIRIDVAPKDGIFRFDVPQLEALLPSGTVDPTVEPVYKELPQWEETVWDARSRYERIIKALADKYPSQNLLLVTHGEGVGVSVSAFKEDTDVIEVDYCAYSELTRQVSLKNESFSAGNFEVLTESGQTGVTYIAE